MIELRRVYKRFSAQSMRAAPGDSIDDAGCSLLAGIDLSVEPGEVVLISGPSGSGKSTLLGLLYGAGRVDSGTVAVFDRAVDRLRSSSIALLRRCVGVVPQNPAFLEDRTAFGNVALALEVRAEPRRTIRERALAAIERVGLADHAQTSIADLSAGQKQWLAIARALVAEPSVVIADDPSAHFDASSRERLIEILNGERERGAAVIVATNDYKLLCAGAQHSWRHVELRAGTLEVIADRRSEVSESSEVSETPEAPVSEAEIPADEGRPSWPGADDYELLEITAEHGFSDLDNNWVLDDEEAELSALNVLPFPKSASAGGVAE